MPEKSREVLESVLKNVTPKPVERAKMKRLAKKLEDKVKSAAKSVGVKAEVRVEGSFAKDTWLSREMDIDVFMRVPLSIPRKLLGDICLKIARDATEGYEQIERFAEHPYLEAIVDGVSVNIVPCYATNMGEWLSATDRTPFHTDYVKNHLDEQMHSEVRLLKKFMKGTGVYGAEIKIGGFSGYLCELLILRYGTFIKTLEVFAKHKQRTILDIQNHYRSRENELAVLFEEPLVVVDPIDRTRNVASAVQAEKLYGFTAAARSFLKNPKKDYFCPPETTPLGKKDVKAILKNRGSSIVFVVFDCAKSVPDVLWGQLYKSQRSLRKLLLLNNFEILRDTAWSDEKGLNIFVFDLENCCLGSVVKHLGPPLNKEEECDKFVSKYLGNDDTVCGPYLDDDRWVVLTHRRFIDACDLLRAKLEDGGRNAGVAEGISQVLKKGFRVLVNEEIDEVYGSNGKFAAFLTEFLQGKPKWLESQPT